MKIDCVFSGGGVKAFSFLGALESLTEKNLQIERVAGTSAGAIVASFIAAGYTSEEIKALMEDLQLKQFLDAPIINQLPLVKWFLFYFQKGLYKGDQLEQWLQHILLQKGIRTFKDLPHCYLKVIVSDISLGRLIVIPDDLERVYQINPNTFSVATAVRMSAGFPFFFRPKKMGPHGVKTKSLIVDGGILSNFPLWIFRDAKTDKRPVLGLTLSDDIENAVPFPIHNALDMLYALFHTMQRAHDTRYITKSKEKNIVFLPVKKVKTTELTITSQEKQTLIQLGKAHTEQFLQHWP